MTVQFRWIGALMVAGVAMTASVALLAQPRPNPAAPRFPLPAEPRVYDTFEQKIRVTVIARGIERPWSLLPLPDGDFLVSVRATGQVLAIHKGVLDPKPLTGIPATHTSRTTGMLDMAMHPKFAENRLITSRITSRSPATRTRSRSGAAATTGRGSRTCRSCMRAIPCGPAARASRSRTTD